MNVTSNAMAAWGATSGVTIPSPEDNQLTIPPVIMPVATVYAPQTLHFGFLTSGQANQSFVYSNAFLNSGVVPASDTIAVRLAPGTWEIDFHIATLRNTAGVTFTDYFQVMVTYDGTVTQAAIYRVFSSVANQAFTESIMRYKIAVAQVQVCDIYVHLPAGTAAGDVRALNLSINARRLT